MSDTTENPAADGPRESTAAPTGDDVRDEVRLDLDEERLDTWEDVRGDYAIDPESEVARPALTESEEDDANDADIDEGDDEEDTEAEDDDEDGSSDEEE